MTRLQVLGILNLTERDENKSLQQNIKKIKKELTSLKNESIKRLQNETRTRPSTDNRRTTKMYNAPYANKYCADNSLIKHMVSYDEAIANYTDFIARAIVANIGGNPEEEINRETKELAKKVVHDALRLHLYDELFALSKPRASQAKRKEFTLKVLGHMAIIPMLSGKLD